MDLDIQTTVGGRFSISFGENPQSVSGNRFLLNRFEIVFMTNTRVMLEGGDPIVDNFGGNASQFINKPQVLNNVRNISLGIAVAVEQTVQSILRDQTPSMLNTEKLSSAKLLGVSIVDGVIVAEIQVVPVETEPFSDLMFRLPITRYEA